MRFSSSCRNCAVVSSLMRCASTARKRSMASCMRACSCCCMCASRCRCACSSSASRAALSCRSCSRRLTRAFSRSCRSRVSILRLFSSSACISLVAFSLAWARASRISRCSSSRRIWCITRSFSSRSRRSFSSRAFLSCSCFCHWLSRSLQRCSNSAIWLRCSSSRRDLSSASFSCICCWNSRMRASLSLRSRASYSPRMRSSSRRTRSSICCSMRAASCRSASSSCAFCSALRFCSSSARMRALIAFSCSCTCAFTLFSCC
mmetsp:Transcript_16654/g.65035  ORF Transcript_16654/g.65035 Transcript_16654/m.65035 type:complete len:262 (+) Transcript_16654:662-1447(+)